MMPSDPDRTMASKVVRALADHGLIRRQANESDARSVRLGLTEAGRDLARRAVAVAQAVDAQVFGAEPGSLRAALRRIAETHPRRSPPG
jgi:DNA-binding MarR family transcriptional regulator